MPKKKTIKEESVKEEPLVERCARCGKVATIKSPDGKPFCDLACKSKFEIK